MRKLIYLFAIIMTTISCSNAQQNHFSEESLKETLINSEGKEVTFKDVLEKHKGKTLLIEVWASWCSDCVKAMPKVKEIQKNNPDVDYVFISMDKSMESWKSGINRHELVGDHYWVKDEKGMKGSFGKSIDLNWIPRYIIVRGESEVTLYNATEKDFDTISKLLK